MVIFFLSPVRSLNTVDPFYARQFRLIRSSSELAITSFLPEDHMRWGDRHVHSQLTSSVKHRDHTLEEGNTIELLMKI